ncbi:zf-TFIIB domain-containing protein [Janibacter sp. G56]|uniref:TFIIB-type zinc ribbon-containing protein n=1 Tax=Janibacter sp. G56 TaxID=3418717 RepID=UPI003D0327FF
MDALTCPKCQSPMRTYERNRVHVDQCTGCGGLFLDRGELEALGAAESAYYAPAPASPAAPAPPQTAQQPYDRRNVGQGAAGPRYAASPRYGYDPSGRPRKKKSFMSEFLDF